MGRNGSQSWATPSPKTFTFLRSVESFGKTLAKVFGFQKVKTFDPKVLNHYGHERKQTATHDVNYWLASVHRGWTREASVVHWLNC
jgi:hypothetical protein